MKKIIVKSVEIGGRTLSLEVGRFAPQANAAVLARYGDTMVLVTVVSSFPKEDLGYFPLSVEYVERLYAGGRIKGSRFIKREGRPSDEAILTARLIDRAIRPLFPKGYQNEVQVVVTVLSVDMENSPEILASVATSAALAISSIPWEGPIGTVKIGLKEGTYFVNPINGELQYSDLELTISATEEKCLMLEAQANQVTEEELLGAVEFAQEEIVKIIKTINSLAEETGKKKQDFLEKKVEEKLKREIIKISGQEIEDLLKRMSLKESNGLEIEAVKGALAEHFPEEKKQTINLVFETVLKEAVRKQILAGKRLDGRKIEEIRPIQAEVGILPRTHGSAVFSRGDTQVLTVTTLGGPSLEQLIEGPEGQETKRFIHHYSMPPFSLGETGRMGSPSRREIGHGALAEKALVAVIPKEESFPYMIRLVSEVMSSNGSTSMASICGSTLSLMDAGVPILAPVVGLALGLVEDKEKVVVLSDIIGLEDFFGDMDFKVAGTEKGITVIQMDVKNHGLGRELLKEIFARGKEGRQFILGKILAVLDKPRISLSQYAPRVAVLHVPLEKIGEVIGPGGRMIRKIIEETKAAVDIEDDGTVNISAADEASVKQAVNLVEGLIREVKPGEIYEGEVKRIQPFGAFVEIGPGKEGLVHVSQMSKDYVSNPEELVSLGQKVKVRVTEIDEQKRINLSMMLDPLEAKTPPPPKFGFRGSFSRPRSPRSRF